MEREANEDRKESKGSQAPAPATVARSTINTVAGNVGAVARQSLAGVRPPKSSVRESSAKPMFADAEAMKEKLRQNMQKPQYDVANFYHEIGLFQMVARHPIFERTTLGVISLNAIYISIDTDANKAMSLLEAAWPFQVCEHFFTYYFTFEWFVRFMAFKHKRNGCRDAWFVFDSSMVVMMVFENWFITFFLILMGGTSSSGGMGNAGIMRLLRLLRLSRMARMARLLRAMPELLILIKGMVSAMRSVFFTLLLQGIILYVFGITFRQLTMELKIGEEYFKDVPTSMHNLLIYGTLMDNIGELVAALGGEGAIYAALFYTFVLISALTVMNMLIGVLCEVVSAVAATEREELTVGYVKARLREILRQGGLDQDGDGMISKVEFAQILENPQAARILSEVGVDVFGLVELSDFIFEKEDESGQNCDTHLTFADFMAVVLDLRGSNTATVKDIVDLRKFMSATAKKLESRLLGMEERIGELMKSAIQAADRSSAVTPMSPQEEEAAESSCFQDPVDRISRSPLPILQEINPQVVTLDAMDEPPMVPNETEIVWDLSVAMSSPNLAQFEENAAASGFDRVRLELNRLRQHVDAELLLIAKEIARKAEGLAVAPCGSGGIATTVSLDYTGARKIEDFKDCPKLMQSSAVVAMSPGAEMSSNVQELLARAGTALAWRSLSPAAQDTLAQSGLVQADLSSAFAVQPRPNHVSPLSF